MTLNNNIIIHHLSIHLRAKQSHDLIELLAGVGLGAFFFF